MSRSLCRKCAGKPSVHARRLQEAADERENQPSCGFMTGFFDSLQSGSASNGG